jgi:hypothetical protein
MIDEDCYRMSTLYSKQDTVPPCSVCGEALRIHEDCDGDTHCQNCLEVGLGMYDDDNYEENTNG